MADATCQAAKATALARLHSDPGILVLVNVWDVASALTVAASPGCTALGTASAAIAASHGYDDGEHIPVDLMLATIGRIVQCTELPVTADLEAGYGDVARTVSAAIGLGAAGANLEDGMAPMEAAVRAVEVAVRAAEREHAPFVLNARTDVFLTEGAPSSASRLDIAAERGKAFLEAGADCVFVPGLTDEQGIAALVEEFGPARLSLLQTAGQSTLQRLQELGVARVSFGPYPQRVAMRALAEMAMKEMCVTPTGS